MDDWFGRFISAGALPNDSGDVRLHKTVIVLSTLIITILSTFWVVTYWLLGLRLAAAIPFAYQVLAAAGLIHFFRTKNFERLRAGQLALMLALPFLLQWTLGGFVNSSGVMLWAFTAPIGAVLFQGPREAVPWFGAYAALTAVSGLIDGMLAAGAPAIPTWLIVVFFVMNITGVSVTTFTLLRYFALERAHALSALNREHERSESLLLSILPKPIADRLKRNPAAIADGYPEATVLFADIVDFTRASAALDPEALVAWLNDLFSVFDGLVERYGLEKIKTIGDAYMAASGLPTPRPDHAECAAEMALAMREEIARRTTPDGQPLRMRIGLHTGRVVAGVIGTRRFIYDLWGDTVNTASRMESHGLPNAIQVTDAAYRRLMHRYEFKPRGTVEVKGKGEMATYLLIGRKVLPAGTRGEATTPASDS
jgi:guanylate cyclase